MVINNKEAKLILKNILNKYTCYTVITKEDANIVSAFFYQSHKEHNKTIKAILIVPQGKHKLFRFIFNNETPVTMGVNKLINTTNTQSKNKAKFKKDCRNIISTQIKKYYAEQIKTGKVKQSKEKLVVDHVYPFSKLIEDYCIKNKLNLNTINNSNKDYQQLIDNFAEFHRVNCTLQLLPHSINAKKSNKL